MITRTQIILPAAVSFLLQDILSRMRFMRFIFSVPYTVTSRQRCFHDQQQTTNNGRMDTTNDPGTHQPSYRWPVKRGSSPVGYVRCSGVLCKYFEIILPALLIASNDLNHCAVARLRSHKTITTPIYGTNQPFAGHACMCVCVFLCLPWSFVGHPVNLVSRT